MGKLRKRRLYDREFKLNTLKLKEKGEISMTQIAKDLGVNINTLSNWRKQYAKSTEKDKRGQRKPRKLKANVSFRPSINPTFQH